MARRSASQPLRPLDPAMIRFVEALAEANAERDHRTALVGGGSAKAKRRT
jgi:hypothetical protein